MWLKTEHYFQISWVTYVWFSHFYFYYVGTQHVCYIFWQYQPFWFVSLFLTDKKVSPVLVCSSIFYTKTIGHYNPSVRIIDLVSHTTYVVCVNFIHKWRYLQFLKPTPNDKNIFFFFRNFSWQFYLLSEVLSEICWEKIAEEILFVFCFDIWPWLEPWLYI